MMNFYNPKRWLVRLSACGLITLSMVAAGSAIPASAGTVQAHAQAKHMTFAFLRSGPDPYYEAGLNGAKAAAKRLNITVKDYFTNVNAAQELSNVEAAISQHVDGIVGYAVSLSAETADIAKANQAHIPIFLMYGYSKGEINHAAGFEQVNLEAYSRPVGHYVAMHLKSGQVAVITGVLGRGDAEGYRTGFEQGLAANKQDKVVTSQAGNWNRQQAFTAAQNTITAFPHVKAMFVENEDMALGAINALTAAHKMGQVMIVSQNGAPYGLAKVRNGAIKASDTCSPALEGVMSVRLLRGVIKHTVKPGHLYYSKTVFVTKSNVGQANPWNPTPAQYNRFMSLPLLKAVPSSQLP